MGNLACLLKVRLTFNQIAVLLQAKPNEFRYFQSKELRQYAWFYAFLYTFEYRHCQVYTNAYQFIDLGDREWILWYISNNTGIFCLFLDAFFYFLVTYITLKAHVQTIGKKLNVKEIYNLGLNQLGMS